jgi:hypothetical protein
MIGSQEVNARWVPETCKKKKNHSPKGNIPMKKGWPKQKKMTGRV